MDKAINKSTGKLIDSFEVHKNGSYQNLNKGEWIAPKDSIYNWDEITEEDYLVHYVKEKEYIKSNGTPVWCDPHFAVYPGSKAKTVEESPIHKLLKRWLFNRLKNDDLNIIYSKGIKPHKYENKFKLSELDINWNDYEIEVTTKGTRKLRADILLPFNKKDIFLGNGIFFEIQISKQGDVQTHNRSIDRALQGYSTCWLFEDDFDIDNEDIVLKNNNVKINSFSEQIHYAKTGFVGKLKDVVEQQCRFLDDKISETNFTIELLDKKKIEIAKELEVYSINLSNSIKESLATREARLIKNIEILEDNPFSGLVDNYKSKIEEEYSNKEKAMGELFNIMMNKLNYPLTLGECNKCHQGYMHFKITRTGKKVYGCSNFPQCKNTVWLN